MVNSFIITTTHVLKISRSNSLVVFSVPRCCNPSDTLISAILMDFDQLYKGWLDKRFMWQHIINWGGQFLGDLEGLDLATGSNERQNDFWEHRTFWQQRKNVGRLRWKHHISCTCHNTAHTSLELWAPHQQFPCTGWNVRDMYPHQRQLRHSIRTKFFSKRVLPAIISGIAYHHTYCY